MKNFVLVVVVVLKNLYSYSVCLEKKPSQLCFPQTRSMFVRNECM